MDQGYASRVWIMQYHGVWIKVWIGGYGSCVGPGPGSIPCILTRTHVCVCVMHCDAEYGVLDVRIKTLWMLSDQRAGICSQSSSLLS